MTDAAEKLKPQLANLSAQDRAELAQFLIDSLDADSTQAYDLVWQAELARRMDGAPTLSDPSALSDAILKGLRDRYL